MRSQAYAASLQGEADEARADQLSAQARAKAHASEARLLRQELLRGFVLAADGKAGGAAEYGGSGLF